MFTCLHHLLTNIQHKTPDAIALYHKHTVVSYRQLGEQVSQQARALRSIGLARRQRGGFFYPSG